MQHFSEDNTIGLRIGHQISVDGREYIAITKGVVDDMGSVFRLKRGGYGTLLSFFSINGGPDHSQEIIFGLEEGVIDRISEKTGLTYEPEMEAGGNVCFANSPEVRDDFKISFSSIDVLNYIHSILNTMDYSKGQKEILDKDFLVLPYPTDSAAFWT